MQASNDIPPPVLGPLQAAQLDLNGYRLLADFRYLIRQFLEFSQVAARRAGLTPRQHQALLVIRGFAAEPGPTVGELAERLCVSVTIVLSNWSTGWWRPAYVFARTTTQTGVVSSSA